MKMIPTPKSADLAEDTLDGDFSPEPKKKEKSPGKKGVRFQRFNVHRPDCICLYALILYPGGFFVFFNFSRR